MLNKDQSKPNSNALLCLLQLLWLLSSPIIPNIYTSQNGQSPTTDLKNCFCFGIRQVELELAFT